MSTETNLNGLVEKHIRSRVILKHDIEANWIKAVNFIPQKGELIIYDVEDSKSELPQGRTFRYNTVRFKFGDGVTNVNDLKFSNSDLASEDVLASSINVAHIAVGDIVGVGVPMSVDEILSTGFAGSSSILAGYGKTSDDILAAGQHGFNIKGLEQSGTSVTITLQPNDESNVERFAEEFAKLQVGMFVYIPTAHSRDASKPAFRPGITKYEIKSVSTTDYTITIQIPEGTRAIGYNGLISDWNISGSTATKCTESSPDGSWQNVPVVLTKRIDYKLYSTDCPDAGTTVISRGALSHGYKTKAIGDGSYAQGRETLTLGDYSHAEGRSTTVYVENGHAEGAHTAVAPNKFFDANGHAEGAKTTARMEAAHAEGQSSASVYSYLDAETIRQDEGGSKILQAWKDSDKGFLMANGRGAHAEGNNTLANANTAHAEGFQTLANKEHTHAEGEGTIADSKHQHVQGKYNVADNKNTYAHIIGGGTSDSERKNIHTIDWSGNANFEGGIDSKQGITVGHNLRNVNYSKGSFSAMFGNSSRYADNKLIPTFLDHQWDSQAAKSMRDDWIAVSEDPNERFSFVFGNGAFACGRNTVALGTSHAEGACTLALKDGAHSEGYETIAQGSYSHAEGQGTIALGNWQHVQGKFNEENANYAHIVGGGTSDAKADRKNIHTIDWNGNAWYAGEITASKFNGNISSNIIKTSEISSSIIKASEIYSETGELLLFRSTSPDDGYVDHGIIIQGDNDTKVSIYDKHGVSELTGSSIQIGSGSLYFEGMTGRGGILSSYDLDIRCGSIEDNLCSIYLNTNTKVSCDGNLLTTPEVVTSKISTSANTLEISASTQFENKAVFNANVSVDGDISCGENITCSGTVKGDVLEVNTIKIGAHELDATKLEKLLKFIETFEFED